jgi:hypothetical protein
MALDLLDDAWHSGHMYRHDLESLFYIILCFACRYETLGKHCCNPPFSKWFAGMDADVLAAKSAFIYRGQVSAIQQHFRFFEPWLKAMFFSIRRGYLSFEQARDSSAEFDRETLGGEFTYEKVQMAMASYNGDALETRRT